MTSGDHAIADKVKVLLVRRGVDLTDASFGVTNGVVTFTGSLHAANASSNDGVDAVVQEVALARWLGRKLKNVDGVRDVIFRLYRVWNAPLGDR